MATDSDDGLVPEDSDSDIVDPSYIPPVPAHAISSSDTDDNEFTNTASASTAQSDSYSNDEGIVYREPSSSNNTKLSSKGSKPKPKPITWFNGRDNSMSNNLPQFSGRFQVNVQANYPKDMYESISSRAIIRHCLSGKSLNMSKWQS